MNRINACLFFVIVGSALVLACSSSTTTSTGTPSLDAASTVTKDANVDVISTPDASVMADANATPDATDKADAALGVPCEAVADCSSAGVCCVRVDLGPAQTGKSFPQCTNVTGAAVCESTVLKCKYVRPSACNARVVSHACNTRSNCTEPGVTACCDVSGVFRVPTGSRVCVDNETASLLELQASGSCL